MVKGVDWEKDLARDVTRLSEMFIDSYMDKAQSIAVAQDTEELEY